jgi:ketosteroid isomerase-like protein
MSQENVEVIQRGYECLNTGDVEGAKGLVDNNCELRTRFTSLAGRPYRGHAGVAQWFADVADSWVDMRQTPQRFIEIDDERTIVCTRIQASGRTSGVEVDVEIASIFTVRGGKVVVVETHPTLAEALKAAGLSE